MNKYVVINGLTSILCLFTSIILFSRKAFIWGIIEIILFIFEIVLCSILWDKRKYKRR